MTTNHPIKSPRKLIEVALPLDAINEAAAREKNNPFVRYHPRSIHTWWARRPFTAARAVVFAQLVNDPGYQVGAGFRYGRNKHEAADERKRLFKILADLVRWENTGDEGVLNRARGEIRRSWQEMCALNKDHPQAAELFNPEKLPEFHDPFAGGGAIPLEAQRLGLKVFASDLNPVAVLINKAMIEVPPLFVGNPPVGPSTSTDANLIEEHVWPGARGLAEDVRRYGAWIRDEAHKRLSDFYPQVGISAAMANNRPDLRPFVGQKVNVVAWLWARTVKSPSPAFSHVSVPLVSSFILSSKDGKDAYIEPVIEKDSYRFTVQIGKPPAHAKEGTKSAGRGANFRCLLSDAAISADYIRNEARAGRMGQRLLAIVAEGKRGRLYLPPTSEHELIASKAKPSWQPDVNFFQEALGFRVGNYGMSKWSDLFTARQILALTTFVDLIEKVQERVFIDAKRAGMPEDGLPIRSGGRGASAYSEAVSLYLALATSRWADFSNALCGWNAINQNLRVLFSRQAIAMTWDFAELSPFSNVGPWFSCVEANAEALRSVAPDVAGAATQVDARGQTLSLGRVVSTDPPYYDNIGYADLSDFFYVWLRRALRSTFPELLATMTVPKAEELVATPARHGGREQAEAFFLGGMTDAMKRLAEQAHPALPITIYYAFKQSDTDSSEGTSSTGWETFLEAVNRAGLQVSGTWPMRTEKEGRSRANDSNALASSIILVCRKRPSEAPTVSRREFIRELNQVLPEALDEMTRGSGDDRSPIAPVDLSQAIIGPGMAIFSKYASVLEADGSAMNVRTALQLINRFLAEDDFDPVTQFCLHWFEQNGWKEGKFGDADTLARAKATSVSGIVESGVVHSGGGKVRLVKFADYHADWDPQKDKRLPVWEVLHHLIRALKQDGERGAGRLLAVVKAKAEAARQLAYRLYTLCERQGWAEDARAYNELITSWTAIESAAGEVQVKEQPTLFGEPR